MILIIGTSILIILTIVFAILYGLHITYDDKWALSVLLPLVAMIILSFCCITKGYEAPNFELRQDIETLLIYNLNEHTIELAKGYNASIDEYNNYWCRFNIEDRSECYIDIDSFINKEKER